VIVAISTKTTKLRGGRLMVCDLVLLH
jgi:hypothetical protein